MPKKPILSAQIRRERHRQEMIDTILDAARGIMREEGVGALNLQELARRVGMRAPSLYNYFPSKMAIYEALFERGMRLFRQRMEQVDAAYAQPSWEASEAALIHYMTFAKENPELYQLLFERPVPGFVPDEGGIEAGRQLIAYSNQRVQELIEARLIAPGLPVEQVRDLFLALMHGLTALHLANEPHLPIGEGRFGSLIPAALALLGKAWGDEEDTT